MISFSDWNALLLYADELEEKFANDHGTKIINAYERYELNV